jgi:hypothetical protein
MRLLIAALLAVFVLSGGRPIDARADTVCPEVKWSMGHAIHDMLVHQPDTVVEKYTGPEAQVGIGLFNRLPDPGDVRGDIFYVMVNPQSSKGLLAVAQGDCLLVWGMWPLETVLGIRAAVEKSKAGGGA